jgi:hypothetical protein
MATCGTHGRGTTYSPRSRRGPPPGDPGGMAPGSVGCAHGGVRFRGLRCGGYGVIVCAILLLRGERTGLWVWPHLSATQRGEMEVYGWYAGPTVQSKWVSARRSCNLFDLRLIGRSVDGLWLVFISLRASMLLLIRLVPHRLYLAFL